MGDKSTSPISAEDQREGFKELMRPIPDIAVRERGSRGLVGRSWHTAVEPYYSLRQLLRVDRSLQTRKGQKAVSRNVVRLRVADSALIEYVTG